MSSPAQLGAPRHRLDTAANIATIVLCALVCLIVLPRILTSDKKEVAHLAVNSQAPQIKGLDYRATDRTLLFGISSTCVHCADSIPFYRGVLSELAPLEKGGHIQSRWVSADAEDVLARFMSAQGLADVAQAVVEPQSPLVRATPSVVLVGRDGRIRASWIGRFNEARAKEVLRAMRRGG